MNKKYFTVEEANQLLPFLQAELESLQGIQKEFYKTYQELQQVRVRSKQEKETTDVEAKKFELECRLEFMQIEYDMHVKSILSTGVHVKDVDLGLIDFPSTFQGEEVLLCWRQGESMVTHYHSLEEGFAGRKKIRE
ncbi:DUF2203 domain-containing protein [Brevibacillus sp. SYSU BS000544]|uniref:DUF2203 domain-containing protein n=1 Tax=Brevibacillus sp. SYSU BS000544 TaxID=3416443 RepID=UPI003CE58DBD